MTQKCGLSPDGGCYCRFEAGHDGEHICGHLNCTHMWGDDLPCGRFLMRSMHAEQIQKYGKKCPFCGGGTEYRSTLQGTEVWCKGNE